MAMNSAVMGLRISALLAALFCAMTVSGSQLDEVPMHILEDRYIDKLEMTVPLPADAYISERSVSPDFEPLEIFGISAGELEVEYKKNNIYCNAIWFGENSEMTEIIISMYEDENSAAIFHLKDRDALYLSSLADSYSSYSEQGLSTSATYSEAEVVLTDQAAYIRAIGNMSSGNDIENHLHYVTVVNGRHIEITLVEHRTVDDPTAFSMRVSRENELMLDEIVAGIVYDSIESKFVSNNRGFLIGTFAVTGLSLLLLAAYAADRIRLSKRRKTD